MKILLTGSTGFLGSALLSRFHDDGVRVATVGRVKNDVKLSEFMSRETPLDGCIHLATCFLPSHSEDQIHDLIDANILFGTRVLDASVRLGCRWFVNAASFWQHAADGAPVNLYSATKEAFQQIVSYYGAAYGLKTASLELTDTYGEGDMRKKLVNVWCQSLVEQIPLQMSQGRQEIELIHKDDVVEGFVELSRMLDSGDARISGIGETYYLPVAEKMTLRLVAKVFEEATGGKLPIQWGARPERAREIMKIEHRGCPLPGWKQKVGLAAGFARLYENFKKRQNKPFTDRR